MAFSLRELFFPEIGVVPKLLRIAATVVANCYAIVFIVLGDLEFLHSLGGPFGETSGEPSGLLFEALQPAEIDPS